MCIVLSVLVPLVDTDTATKDLNEQKTSSLTTKSKSGITQLGNSASISKRSCEASVLISTYRLMTKLTDPNLQSHSVLFLFHSSETSKSGRHHHLSHQHLEQRTLRQAFPRTIREEPSLLHSNKPEPTHIPRLPTNKPLLQLPLISSPVMKIKKAKWSQLGRSMKKISSVWRRCRQRKSRKLEKSSYPH